MVESRSRPGRRAVALLTGLRKSALHMVRTGCALVVLQVTRHTRCHSDVVVIVDMTVGALPGRNYMSACERKTRGGVIKLGSGPGRCVVTLLAGLCKSALHVIGIGRCLEVF